MSCDWDELLRRSNVLSLHVPLLAETHHLIDRAAMAAMPVGAVLINTSRGGVVDENALINALRSGHLGGAALDVYEEEPPPSKRLATDTSLRKHAVRVILTTTTPGTRRITAQ